MSGYHFTYSIQAQLDNHLMRQRFVDPFFPNRPVDDPGRFAGRVEQVDEVVDSLYQISNENPKHTIITGGPWHRKKFSSASDKTVSRRKYRVSRKTEY
jgi:hypothetical protein